VLPQQPDPLSAVLGMQRHGALHNKAPVGPSSSFVLTPWHKSQLFRSCVLASVSLLDGNSSAITSFLALRAGSTFFQGVLTRAELGSQGDTYKGDPRSDKSMSCWRADHSQPASAPPEFSSASQ